uniref:Uncharacterized protein n=1 Tax=Oryza sativa subsp. indica TaxID=39946 RepID=C5NNP4_ORYSI|nr:hypothetical protein [Oryza sativa Indica Group]
MRWWLGGSALPSRLSLTALGRRLAGGGGSGGHPPPPPLPDPGRYSAPSSPISIEQRSNSHHDSVVYLNRLSCHTGERDGSIPASARGILSCAHWLHVAAVRLPLAMPETGGSEWDSQIDGQLISEKQHGNLSAISGLVWREGDIHKSS